MDTVSELPDATQRRAALSAMVATMAPMMRARAAALDADGGFPHEDMTALANAGGALAPFPQRVGGLGLGTVSAGAVSLKDILIALGRGNLAVGRLFEGHVNAVRLLARYGSPTQLRRAANDAAAGQFFGLWVTDPASDGLRATADGLLHGGKAFCSGAGYVAHAVVTATDSAGEVRLAYLPTATALATPLGNRLHGMRGACTGRVSFEGRAIGPDDWLGVSGDFLREPDFSTGAWRSSAVACGGLMALVEVAMQQLLARGRAGDPHQTARMGRAWIAQQTAALWIAHAAVAAEGPPENPAEMVATVHFARLAIEAACLEAMTLIERSLGLAAFMETNPIERMRRDLATYLRQPAPDEILTEATTHVMRTRIQP